jgi:putative transcriptional regulator
MVKYHPDTRFLTDYAAGSLPEAQALCVASHLHYCAACRLKIRELIALGTELFLLQSPLAVSSADFERLLARVDTLLQLAPAADTDTSRNKVESSEQSKQPSALPLPLHKLSRGNIESLKWRRIGTSFRYSHLKIDPQRETTLFHIMAGCSVPHHRHQGDEITVVIKGSFSDHDDKYHAGDFIVRTEGEQHRPVASQDEDCLCLSTLDAPIVMSNWFYRVLQPLL